MKLRLAALPVLAALALAGCASPDATDSAGAPSSSSPASAPASASPAPSVVPSGALSGEITVTGQVKDGVEAGCVLLSTADKTYLLLGGDPSKYRSGVKLTVTGVPQAGLATTCQQGTPLQVVSIKEG
ncbi:hypothetical protein KZZ52_54030 [Dactylosporangium sp. AC04546]|uniref:hypothetical protein n=1 Tax=Dactylosporangium sp. AC04546 TaxID=2862460 RepID=UPI001EE0B22E|nr:hypothetical protein [Dactylosporangium sp. AC04546]WVK82776.1 hypothetical protein KZZ52_54030 [Dactylosporangium sp. AC04546]